MHESRFMLTSAPVHLQLLQTDSISGASPAIGRAFITTVYIAGLSALVKQGTKTKRAEPELHVRVLSCHSLGVTRTRT